MRSPIPGYPEWFLVTRAGPADIHPDDFAMGWTFSLTEAEKILNEVRGRRDNFWNYRIVYLREGPNGHLFELRNRDNTRSLNDNWLPGVGGFLVYNPVKIPPEWGEVAP